MNSLARNININVSKQNTLKFNCNQSFKKLTSTLSVVSVNYLQMSTKCRGSHSWSRGTSCGQNNWINRKDNPEIY